jgi:hypothetical protein
MIAIGTFIILYPFSFSISGSPFYDFCTGRPVGFIMAGRTGSYIAVHALISYILCMVTLLAIPYIVNY